MGSSDKRRRRTTKTFCLSRIGTLKVGDARIRIFKPRGRRHYLLEVDAPQQIQIELLKEREDRDAAD